ncbi:MAG: pentapeptide repeat-containing protein, partial [Pseudomonadales bacterium]|nr:pentapeptide repeat-containing protein [Pseudomonadales bacterium]
LKYMGADFPSTIRVIDESGEKVTMSSGGDEAAAVPLLIVSGVESVQNALEAHCLESPAQFINTDLSSLDLFKDRDLRGVSFRGSDCYGIDFSGSYLTGCDFTNARSLETCNFRNTTMDSETYAVLKKGNAWFDDTVRIVAQ